MGGAETIRLLQRTRSMTHRNSPLTPAGRQHMVLRVEFDRRAIANVAAEAGVAARRSRSGCTATAPTNPRHSEIA